MDILYLYYSPKENVFYDECGQRIYNILELLTPKDIYLCKFTSNNGPFPYIHIPGVWCEIVDFDEPFDDFDEEIDDPFMDEELEQAYIRWGLDRSRV